MKYCPNPTCSFLAEMKQVAEYQDHVTHCADCGAALAEGDAPDPASMLRAARRSQLGALEPIAGFVSREDAERYRAQLELAGVPAVVEESNNPELPDWKARLLVRESDLAAAFRIIDLMEEEEESEEGEYEDDDENDDEWDADDEEYEDEENDETIGATVVNTAPPGSLEQRYPTIAEWINGGGQITIGRDYDSGSSSTVFASDPGGVVWESEEEYATLDALFLALEQGLQEWIEENE
jgi:hypothetical protein